MRGACLGRARAGVNARFGYVNVRFMFALHPLDDVNVRFSDVSVRFSDANVRLFSEANARSFSDLNVSYVSAPGAYILAPREEPASLECLYRVPI